MLRDASNEIRLHPGRFAATLIAIAISIGFISAISIFVSTQQAALSKSNALGISRADAVVTVDAYIEYDENGSPVEPQPPVDQSRLEAIDEVAAAQGILSFDAMLTHGKETIFFALYGEPDEAFRWSELVEGRFPEAPDELALSQSGARRLGVEMGDQVSVEGDEGQFTVVGLTDDPRSLFQEVGFMDPGPGSMTFSYAVKAAEGVSPEQLVNAISAAIGHPEGVVVRTGMEERTTQLNDLTAELDLFKYLLWGFGGLALVIGMITIANTFTILVAQRRRQVGLLRAVGASTGQVIGRQLAESALLGLIGSLLGVGLGFGVAAIGANVTGAVYWGFDVKWGELGIALLLGVLATVVSAVAPAIRASRVKPLEALQAVPTETQAKRAGAVRIVICALALLGGVALVIYSRGLETWALPVAMAAGALLTVAVLGMAPLYVAPLLRLLGRLFGPLGPTVRLAFTNASRNPARAASTATALMLAVGLIVTLQVALATTRTTGMATIDEQVPIDVAASSGEQLPSAAISRLETSAAVQKLILIDTKMVEAEQDGSGFFGRAYDAERAFAEWGMDPLEKLADDTVYVSPYEGYAGGETIELPGTDGPVVLKVVTSDRMGYAEMGVTGANYQRLAGEVSTTHAWIKLVDRTSTTQLNEVVTILGAYPEVVVEGGAMIAGILQQVLDVMLIVLTALLGVAVLIALVGVGNTLGLSVIERQRESALLRALGMQRAGLRRMLLIEAVALVAVGTVIGVAAGAFFGWLGVSSTIAGMNEAGVDLRFSVDIGYTAALIGVCLVAACLASVLPGRKAANATPTEALAVD